MARVLGEGGRYPGAIPTRMSGEGDQRRRDQWDRPPSPLPVEAVFELAAGLLKGLGEDSNCVLRPHETAQYNRAQPSPE